MDETQYYKSVYNKFWVNQTIGVFLHFIKRWKK